MFVIAMRVARSILECVYCCHTAKRVSASGVHKTQPKVPIQGPNHPTKTTYTGATYILVQNSTQGFNAWATKPYSKSLSRTSTHCATQV